ncbi:MAG: DUF1616 domain-containing protein [Nanoarchaeota archaeon]
MKTKLNKWFLGGLISVVIFFLISLTITIFTSQTFLSSLRIVFGSVYVLFLPGFIISFIFFPKTKEFEAKSKEIETSKNLGSLGIDWIERIALSFALSIAIVPLIVFYLNLIGLKINLLNSFLTILGITLISFGILYWRARRKL